MAREVIPGVNDLATTHPDLAAQWHPTKNGDLSPTMISRGCNKKAWWQCEENHEWEAKIANRAVLGRNCPYCARQRHKPRSSVSNLAAMLPDIAAQWHPTKNGDLTPDQVAIYSHQKVWWSGPCGHEWEAAISHRSEGRGCPYCAGKLVLPGVNDLASANPDLAKEWHPFRNGTLMPHKVAPSSNKKAWWQCEKGHEWQAVINSRTRGCGCPYCSNKSILAGYNDLATIYPELAAEWHPTKNGSLTPQTVSSANTRRVHWLGKCGHEWEATINSRSHLGTGCPICAKELHSSFPEQAVFFYISKVFPDAVNTKGFEWLGKMTLDIYIPSISTAIEYDGSPWHKNKDRDLKKNRLCDKNHVRVIRFRDPCCPEISGECIKLKSLNREDLDAALRTLFQNFLQCDTIPDINVDRDRFHICELIGYAKKENSIAVRAPHIAALWHPTKNGNLTPDQITLGSERKVWWRCEKGHEWEGYASSLRGVCPICSNKRIQPGVNDLATVNPKIAAQWHPTKNESIAPDQVTAGSSKRAWWQCERGHEWEAIIHSRTKLGTGCPYCSGSRVITGQNDLASLRPELIQEWHPTKNNDLTPDMVAVRSGKKAWWKCKTCGHEWNSIIAARSNGVGCPACKGRKISEAKRGRKMVIDPVTKKITYVLPSAYE